MQIIIGLGGKGDTRGVLQSSFQVKRAARERERKRARGGLAGRPGMPASLRNLFSFLLYIGIQDSFSVKGEQNIKVLGPLSNN